MKPFIKQILLDELEDENKSKLVYENSKLLKYLDSKMGAIYGNSKTRRSLANIYAIYSLSYFYEDDFYNKPEEYKEFEGYEYTKLFNFYRGLYGGNKLQNHALNSRVNGEFKNKIVNETENDLIVINNGKYALHIEYLYVNGIDISVIVNKIVEEYISILVLKDSKLLGNIQELIELEKHEEKLTKLQVFLEEDSEARIFEIVSYAILKNHYKNTKVFIGYSKDDLTEEYLTLYKTGRTNANDGGIDFVMKPLGRFFQVTEVNVYDKFLLDIDKVMHFPITFIVRTKKTKEMVNIELDNFIIEKSKGMKMIKDRYKHAIEEVITINELIKWMTQLSEDAVNDLLRDIDMYYKLELNLNIEED